jgi:hypothetical protein
MMYEPLLLHIQGPWSDRLMGLKPVQTGMGLNQGQVRRPKWVLGSPLESRLT